MSHRNARLTVHGRRILVQRVLAGCPVAHVAAEMGISCPTAHTWISRWRAGGEAGLHDRPSRPVTTPHRTPAGLEARVCRLRTDRKLHPAGIGPILGLPASTVRTMWSRSPGRRRRQGDRRGRGAEEGQQCGRICGDRGPGGGHQPGG
ncbi:hypothetical protein GCM10010286_15310 [Streptomyces toxytricini]|nr:hypothetical protein GCM10010286_15310 [Streptomyces toxytricini]